MPITTNDIRLQQSEVISDAPEGGGRASANEVVDGELNNLFDDISRLDRVYGRVSLRKAFLRVRTDDTSKYLGSHAIVTDPPLDGQVAVTMFQTHADTRNWDRHDDAQERVESYLAAGRLTQWTLYGDHLAGQLQVLFYARDDDARPQIGDVLCLSVESGATNLGEQQFIRIQSVTSERLTFHDGTGYFDKQVITITISQPLTTLFPGGEVVRNPLTTTSATLVRATNRAEGATYYGIVPLAEDIGVDETDLRVTTILQPLVPSASTEEPIVDQPIGPEVRPAVVAGESFTEELGSLPPTGSGLEIVPLRGMLPGSVTLTAGSGSTALTLDDDGAGALIRSAGGSGTVGVSGFIDYRAPRITLSGLPAGAISGYALTYTPAAYPTQVSHTLGEPITEANRGLTRVQTLPILPAPGTTIVAYRSLEKWYTLTDIGDGVLSGDPGTGSGVVNLETGSVSVTLGYEPDVGSSVLYGWGSQTLFDTATDAVDFDLGFIEGQLPGGVIPGTGSVSWAYDGTTYTATDDGAGNLTGDGTGHIYYGSGTVHVVPNVVPPPATNFTFSGTVASAETEFPTFTSASGTHNTFTVADAPVVTDSARLRVAYHGTGVDGSAKGGYCYFRASGTSMVQETGASAGYEGFTQQGESAGTIQYSSGTINFPKQRQFRYYTIEEGEKVERTMQISVFTDTGEPVKVEYIPDGATQAAEDSAQSADALSISLNTALAGGIVPESMLVRINGQLFYDANGSMYTRSGGANLPVGAIDYATGQLSLTEWPAGADTAEVLACAVRAVSHVIAGVTWHTAGAPVRVSSFTITAIIDGVQTTLSSDSNGNVGGLAGTINYATGVYAVSFPAPIDPTTARYNAVVQSWLPLDAELLGLDPTRLPLDGRVPVIEAGMTLVIHDTQTVTLPNPVVAGTPYGVGRDRISYAIVRDADGVAVDTTKYEQDLIEGEVTFLAPLDLSDYTQPLTVEHRIEDMVLCLSANLSGQVTMFGRITHDFTAANSYVSSALAFGDLQAAVHSLFTQETWLDDWDAAGTPTDANFNNVTYPIATTNDGAITERWRTEFTSAIAFEVIGESTGIVAVGQTDADCAPINPSSGQPYFTIPWQGWGVGWSPGNNLRFSTRGAEAPIWFARCTLQGPLEDPVDRVRVQLRGDSN